ncbi:hypothetical protein [Thalassotalea fusca]
MTNLTKNTIFQTVLVSACVFALTACISSPEKSTHKINAISNAAPSSINTPTSAAEQDPIAKQDRCDRIKPTDKYYNLCKERVRKSKSEKNDDSVVFEWKKQ